LAGGTFVHQLYLSLDFIRFSHSVLDINLAKYGKDKEKGFFLVIAN